MRCSTERNHKKESNRNSVAEEYNERNEKKNAIESINIGLDHTEERICELEGGLKNWSYFDESIQFE